MSESSEAVEIDNPAHNEIMEKKIIHDSSRQSSIESLHIEPRLDIEIKYVKKKNTQTGRRSKTEVTTKKDINITSFSIDEFRQSQYQKHNRRGLSNKVYKVIIKQVKFKVKADVEATIELPNNETITASSLYTLYTVRRGHHGNKMYESTKDGVSVLKTLRQINQSNVSVSASLDGETVTISCDNFKTTFEKNRDVSTYKNVASEQQHEYLLQTGIWNAGELKTIHKKPEEGVYVLPVDIGKTTLPLNYSEETLESEESTFWSVIDKFGGGDPTLVEGEPVEVAHKRFVGKRDSYYDGGAWCIREPKDPFSERVKQKIVGLLNR